MRGYLRAVLRHVGGGGIGGPFRLGLSDQRGATFGCGALAGDARWHVVLDAHVDQRRHKQLFADLAAGKCGFACGRGRGGRCVGWGGGFSAGCQKKDGGDGKCVLHGRDRSAETAEGEAAVDGRNGAGGNDGAHLCNFVIA